jgi:hypothetical protein
VGKCFKDQSQRGEPDMLEACNHRTYSLVGREKNKKPLGGLPQGLSLKRGTNWTNLNTRLSHFWKLYTQQEFYI